jgi:IS5 family transposase
MDASDLIKALQNILRGGGRPHMEHRDQAQHHQGAAQAPAGLGGAGGAGAVAGTGLGEHPYHVVKNLFRHKKLRYRDLAKNTAQLHTLFALANLVIVKKILLAQPRA